jgi:hypothetical protein
MNDPRLALVIDRYMTHLTNEISDSYNCFISYNTGNDLIPQIEPNNSLISKITEILVRHIPSDVFESVQNKHDDIFRVIFLCERLAFLDFEFYINILSETIASINKGLMFPDISQQKKIYDSQRISLALKNISTDFQNYIVNSNIVIN